MPRCRAASLPVSSTSHSARAPSPRMSATPRPKSLQLRTCPIARFLQSASLMLFAVSSCCSVIPLASAIEPQIIAGHHRISAAGGGRRCRASCAGGLPCGVGRAGSCCSGGLPGGLCLCFRCTAAGRCVFAVPGEQRIGGDVVVPPPLSTSLLTPKASATTTSASANSPIVATGMLTPPARGRGPCSPRLDGAPVWPAPAGHSHWIVAHGRRSLPSLRARPPFPVGRGRPPPAAAPAAAAAAAGAAAPGTPSPRYTGSNVVRPQAEQVLPGLCDARRVG